VKKSLKEHRTSKQLSQQELAEKSGISIRTIQRIEKRHSSGSPYIVKSLCNALEIEVDTLDLDIIPEASEAEYQNEIDQAHTAREANEIKNKVKLVNFSSLFILLFPFLNVIIPLLIFRKYKSSFRNNLAVRKIISFQIIWTVGMLAALLFIPPVARSIFGLDEYAGYPLYLLLYFLFVFFNVVTTLATAVRINKSEEVLPFIPNLV
jgi:transcriptional regulator with XRE-family HTH domain